MYDGAIIGNLDVAQLLVIVFFLFFAGLVLHLRQEDKREGYPLRDPAGGSGGEGFPPMPAPKTFLLMDGQMVTAPHPELEPPMAARREFPFPGSALAPTGDPLRDGVGPAAFPLRRDTPIPFLPGLVQVAPLRAADGWSLAAGDPDPRGMTVLGADGVVAGVVSELWIDRSVKILRYLEVEVTGAAEGGPVLLPIYYSQVDRKRGQVRVSAIRAAGFAAAPRLRDADQITAREEDQVNAFYAGGRFFRGPIDRDHSNGGRSNGGRRKWGRRAEGREGAAT